MAACLDCVRAGNVGWRSILQNLDAADEQLGDVSLRARKIRKDVSRTRSGFKETSPAHPVFPEQVLIRYACECHILDGPVWPEAVELAEVACGERRVVCREELWICREVVPGCLQLTPLRLPCLVDLLERRLAQCGRHSTAESGREAGEVCGKSGLSSLAGLGQSGSASLAVRVYQSRDPATRSECVR